MATAIALTTMPSVGEGTRPEDELTELRQTGVRTYGKLSVEEINLRKHSGGTAPRTGHLEAPTMPRRTDFGEYYPDGGWGWCVCGAAFIVHFVAHGIHLAFGSLMVEIQDVFGATPSESVWVGSVGFGCALLVCPLVVTICRRKSPRMLAVVGGLVSALGCLFLSFSVQLHQLYISYVTVLSLGTATTLSTASIVIGRYFHKRRECAEMLILTGSGAGMAAMSIFMRQIYSPLTWMRTLQGITGLALLTVIAGLFYRSVSLYHPRRKAILHIKNLRKTKKQQREFENKPPYFDFSPLRMRSLQLLMLSTAMTSLGMYTPYCLLAGTAQSDGVGERQVLLLMVFLGVAFAFGALLFGMLTVRSSLRCMVARQYLCQLSGLGAGLATMLLTLARGFDALALYVWIYGMLCGGYCFTIKVYTYELVSVKLSERSWGFIALAQAVPTLVGAPIALHLNVWAESSLRAGFLFAGVMMALGAVLLCAMPWASTNHTNHTVIQTAHLGTRNLQDDILLYGMEVSDCSSTPQYQISNGPLTPPPVGRHRSYYNQSSPRIRLFPEVGAPASPLPDLSKISEEERWRELERSRPLASADRVTDFLVRSQQMLQDLGSRANVDIPGVQLHINNRFVEETSTPATDYTHYNEPEAEISGIRLEATVSSSPKRVVTCKHADTEMGEVQKEIQDLILEATVNRPSPKKRRRTSERTHSSSSGDPDSTSALITHSEPPDITQGHRCVLETCRPCAVVEEDCYPIDLGNRVVTVHRTSPRNTEQYVYSMQLENSPGGVYCNHNGHLTMQVDDPPSSNHNHTNPQGTVISIHTENTSDVLDNCGNQNPSQRNGNRNLCSIERFDCDDPDAVVNMYDGPTYCGSVQKNENVEKTTSV